MLAKKPGDSTAYKLDIDPEPSRAMAVWVPSRRGSIRMVAVTCHEPSGCGCTLTSPNGSTTFLIWAMAAFPKRKFVGVGSLLHCALQKSTTQQNLECGDSSPLLDFGMRITPPKI